MAPLLVTAAFAAPVELVVEMVVELVVEPITTGLLFTNASKTLKTPFPPQAVLLSPVQGTLQSVWLFAHSPPTKLLHQH